MSEPFIGEVVLFGGNFAPRNWALCDGQLLQINQNQALFSILGTTYGGDGETTFALPDLRGRVPIGTGSGPGLTPRSLGQSDGTETVTLNSTQMPSHMHTGPASGLSATLRGHTGSEAEATAPSPTRALSKFTTPIGVNAYSNSEANQTPIGGPQLVVQSVANTGGSQVHENRQPLLGVNYIIAIRGIFPSRN